MYRCDDCGSQFEKRQSFTDEPLVVCEACQGRLRKIIQPTTVIYKGSGFYSTDYGSKSGGNGRNGSSEKEDSGSKSAAGEDKKSGDVAKAEAKNS